LRLRNAAAVSFDDDVEEALGDLAMRVRRHAQ
jgi:hypothetical protein